MGHAVIALATLAPTRAGLTGLVGPAADSSADRLAPGLAAAGGEAGRHGDVVCVLDGRVETSDEPGRRVHAGTVAALYGRHGASILARLRGEFALLLWDAERREGVLARDHVGLRLVCFTERPGGVAFATEVADLLDMLPRVPDPDGAVAARWLAGRPAGAGRTLFSGVRRLAAGHLLRLTADGPRAARYWDVRYAGTLGGTSSESAAAMRTAVGRAVERCTAGGARAGVLLSGGLDSSLVAGMAQRGCGEPRLAGGWSATFPGRPELDESERLDLLTGDLGLPSFRHAVRGGSMLAAAADHVRRWEEPPMAPFEFFEAPLLQAAARAGLTVMLDGEGGDEVFGERFHLAADRLRRGRALSCVRLIAGLPQMEGARPRAVVRGVAMAGVRAALPPGLHERLRRARGRDAPPGWLLAGAVADAEAGYEPWAWKRAGGPRWWAHTAHVLAGGAIDELGITDHLRRRAARHGIAARHPLLDVDLIELALRVPPEHTFGPRSRQLQRDVASGLVPDGIRLAAGKARFDGLLQSTLSGELPAFRALLGDPRAEIRRYVDAQRVREQLLEGPARHPAGAHAWADELWRAVTLELWLRQRVGAPPSTFSRLDPDPSIQRP